MLGWQATDIAYCSNVHAGENTADIKQNLVNFIQPVRKQRNLGSMATGLWISAVAARELQDIKQLIAFQQSMTLAKLRLTSINGFPYGGFHQEQVKFNVYLPDWSAPARLNYTKQLANILAACLPDDCHSGVISSLPLGYKLDWSTDKQQRALIHLKELTDHLDKIAQHSGKKILVCLEMEPDCLLESTTELIQFFQQNIHSKIPHNNYLAICYDVCHQAVMYEDAEDSLNQITEAGITIGKIQLSNALQIDFSSSRTDNHSLIKLLTKFSEPKYLHQVKIRNHRGQLSAYADLSLALEAVTDATTSFDYEQSWRIHFHVPLSHQHLIHSKLQTTHDALQQTFNFLHANNKIRPLLEVETYSWQVLPKVLRPQNNADLIVGIVDELRWVEEQLAIRNLLVS